MIALMKLVLFVFFTDILAPRLALATESGEEVKEKAKETIMAVKKYSKEQKDVVVEDLESSFNALKEKINDLGEKARQTSAETQSQIAKKVDHLKSEQSEIDQKISKLKKTSGKAWNHLHEGLVSAVKKLEKSYKDAKEEISK